MSAKGMKPKKYDGYFIRESVEEGKILSTLAKAI